MENLYARDAINQLMVWLKPMVVNLFSLSAVLIGERKNGRARYLRGCFPVGVSVD